MPGKLENLRLHCSRNYLNKTFLKLYLTPLCWLGIIRDCLFSAYTFSTFSCYIFNTALRRLKFEEFFLAQVKLNITRINRNRNSRGILFEKVGDLFTTILQRLSAF